MADIVEQVVVRFIADNASYLKDVARAQEALTTYGQISTNLLGLISKNTRETSQSVAKLTSSLDQLTQSLQKVASASNNTISATDKIRILELQLQRESERTAQARINAESRVAQAKERTAQVALLADSKTKASQNTYISTVKEAQSAHTAFANNVDSETIRMFTHYTNLGAQLGYVVRQYLSIYAAIEAIKQTIGTGLDFNKTMESSQLAFTVMMKSASDAKATLQDLYNFAVESPLTFKETVEASRQLMAYGFTAKELIPTMQMLGTVGKAVGSSMSDMAYVYGTLRAQNRAYTRDLMQFAMRGIPIYEELAKVMNKPVEQIQKLTSEGLVSFEEVEQAFKNMTDSSGRFGGLLTTWMSSLEGMKSKLQDVFANVMGGATSKLYEDLKIIIQKVTDYIGSAEFKKSMDSFGNDIVKLMDVFVSFIQTLIRLKDQIIALVEAVIVFKTTMGLIQWITNIPAMILNIAKSLANTTMALELAQVGVVSLTQALNLLKTAFLTNPWAIFIVGATAALTVLFNIKSKIDEINRTRLETFKTDLEKNPTRATETLTDVLSGWFNAQSKNGYSLKNLLPQQISFLTPQLVDELGSLAKKYQLSLIETYDMTKGYIASQSLQLRQSLDLFFEPYRKTLVKGVLPPTTEEEKYPDIYKVLQSITDISGKAKYFENGQVKTSLWISDWLRSIDTDTYNVLAAYTKLGLNDEKKNALKKELDKLVDAYVEMYKTPNEAGEYGKWAGLGVLENRIKNINVELQKLEESEKAIKNLDQFNKEMDEMQDKINMADLYGLNVTTIDKLTYNYDKMLDKIKGKEGIFATLTPEQIEQYKQALYKVYLIETQTQEKEDAYKQQSYLKEYTNKIKLLEIGDDKIAQVEHERAVELENLQLSLEREEITQDAYDERIKKVNEYYDAVKKNAEKERSYDLQSLQIQLDELGGFKTAAELLKEKNDLALSKLKIDSDEYKLYSKIYDAQYLQAIKNEKLNVAALELQYEQLAATKDEMQLFDMELSIELQKLNVNSEEYAWTKKIGELKRKQLEEQIKLKEAEKKLSLEINEKELNKLILKVAGISAYASGTQGAKPGMALVGEQGPELVYFKGGETVIPNEITRNLIGYADGTEIPSDIKKQIDATINTQDLKTIIHELTEAFKPTVDNYYKAWTETLNKDFIEDLLLGQSHFWYEHMKILGVDSPELKANSDLEQRRLQVYHSFYDEKAGYADALKILKDIVEYKNIQDIPTVKEILDDITVKTKDIGASNKEFGDFVGRFFNVPVFLQSLNEGTSAQFLPSKYIIQLNKSWFDAVGNANDQMYFVLWHEFGHMLSYMLNLTDFRVPYDSKNITVEHYLHHPLEVMANLLGGIANIDWGNYLYQLIDKNINEKAYKEYLQDIDKKIEDEKKRLPHGEMQYASGTSNAHSGWALVGERGPELVNFKGGETVLPNHITNTILGYAKGTTQDLIVDASAVGTALVPIFERLISSIQVAIEKQGGSEVTKLSEKGSNFDSILTPLISSFGDLFTSIEGVMQLFSPLQTILKGFMNTVGPELTTAIQPLLNIFSGIGKILGSIFLPVIRLVGKAFEWLYDSVFVPVGNFIIDLINGLISLINMLPFVNIAYLDHLETVEEMNTREKRLAKAQNQLNDTISYLTDKLKEEINNQLDTYKYMYEVGLITASEYEAKVEELNKYSLDNSTVPDEYKNLDSLPDIYNALKDLTAVQDIIENGSMTEQQILALLQSLGFEGTLTSLNSLNSYVQDILKILQSNAASNAAAASNITTSGVNETITTQQQVANDYKEVVKRNPARDRVERDIEPPTVVVNVEGNVIKENDLADALKTIIETRSSRGYVV